MFSWHSAQLDLSVGKVDVTQQPGTPRTFQNLSWRQQLLRLLAHSVELTLDILLTERIYSGPE